MEITSSIGQELYDMLKGNTNHVLKDYILTLDNYLDDDSILRAVGDRIGIHVPDKEYAPVYLYLRLKDYLSKEKDPELTRKIVNMTPTEYFSNDIPYEDRLIL